MLFDAATPNTSAYMVAGYAIFSVVAAIYLLSLFIRTRNLERDRLALQGLREEQEQPAAPPMRAAGSAPKARKSAAKPSKPAARKKTARKTSRRK